MSAFEKIAAQQKGKENTAPWMVGEQLKEICSREPLAAELVEKDLAVKEMSLEACEKKIKEWADKHKKGGCAVVPPNVAEKIIREFYGIPAAGNQGTKTSSGAAAPPSPCAGKAEEAEIVDFTAFL